jgi:hypothetical protein
MASGTSGASAPIVGIAESQGPSVQDVKIQDLFMSPSTSAGFGSRDYELQLTT